MSNDLIYRLEDGTFVNRKPMYVEVSRDGVKLVSRYIPAPEDTIFIYAAPINHGGSRVLGKYKVIDREYCVESNDMTIRVQLVREEIKIERQ